MAREAPRCATLRRRADFLRAARALRQASPALLLQGRFRAPGEHAEAAIRVGFTCSKKVGNAVTRNRAKRRLRAVAQEVIGAEGRPGWDYVLVGRPGATITRPFAALTADLRGALARLHRTADRSSPAPHAAPPSPAEAPQSLLPDGFPPAHAPGAAP